jgi:hypothetical protein
MPGKRIAFALTTALIALGIAACGGASPPGGMPEPDDPMMGRAVWTAPAADSGRASLPAGAPRTR